MTEEVYRKIVREEVKIMQEIEIKLTMQQVVAVMMAIDNQMDSYRNMMTALQRSGESPERLEIMNSKSQRLTEAYKAIQAAM